MDNQELMRDRNNQEGQYSLYNYLYHNLLDNYEPEQLANKNSKAAAERQLMMIGKEYGVNGGKDYSDDELRDTAVKAVEKFIANDKQVGSDHGNMGTGHVSNVDNIKESLMDLRW